MTTNQTVWVCIATYEARSGVEPICAVAFTAQEAEEQIANVIHERCEGDEEYMEHWLSHPPIERPVLPVDATPRGVEAWKAAGISDGDIEAWFQGQVDLIDDDPRAVVHLRAANMTADDFREDFLFDVDDNERIDSHDADEGFDQ
jgi:hypothetical protein